MKNKAAIWKLLNDSDWKGLEKSIADGKWDPNEPLTLSSREPGVLLLAVAAGHGLLGFAKQLLDCGAKVDGRVKNEASPLVFACQMGYREVANLLLDAGANANAKSLTDDRDSGETPLMFTATFGRIEIAQDLLQRGANVRATTRKGRSALSFLVSSGHSNRRLVRLLLEAGCPVDGRDLHFPIYDRDLEIVTDLLAKKPDVNKTFDWPTHLQSPEKGDTPLFVAVARNPSEMLGNLSKRSLRLQIIELLIKAGADVNAQRGSRRSGWTPLMLAVAQDDDEVANRLMRAGADPNKTIECSRYVEVDGDHELRKGPLTPIGMANERPENKKMRRVLLGRA